MAGASTTLHKVLGSFAIGLTVCIGTVGLSSGALADSGAVDVSSSKVAAAQEMLPGAAGQPPIQGVRVSMGGYSIVLPEEAQAVQTDEEGILCWGCEGLSVTFGGNLLAAGKPSEFASFDFQASVEVLAKGMDGSEVFPLGVPSNLAGCPTYGFGNSDGLTVMVFLPQTDGRCAGVIFAASVEKWLDYVEGIAASIRPVDVELFDKLQMLPSDLSPADLSLIGRLPALNSLERDEVQTRLVGQSGLDSVLYSLDSLQWAGDSVTWMASIVSTNSTGLWTRGQIEDLLLLCGIEDPDFNNPQGVYSFSDDKDEAANEPVSGSYDPGSGKRAMWEFFAVGDLPLVIVGVTFA